MPLSIAIEPVLHPVKIADLRPTQMAVGLHEVHRKRIEWRERPRDEAGTYLGAHMVPAVIGPGGHPWLIDHHHLVLALHLEDVRDVLVSVVAHLDHLPKKRFYAFMDAQNWLHPFDADGNRKEWKHLPKHIGELGDDPYRSLAGAVRRAGGYAKSVMPYAEFLWADFFRDRIRHKQVTENFPKAVERALPLARDHAARHLPGWAGGEHQG